MNAGFLSTASRRVSRRAAARWKVLHPHAVPARLDRILNR
jgi:hypothetical protein